MSAAIAPPLRGDSREVPNILCSREKTPCHSIRFSLPAVHREFAANHCGSCIKWHAIRPIEREITNVPAKLPAGREGGAGVAQQP
jgi:hypothetical protein